MNFCYSITILLPTTLAKKKCTRVLAPPKYILVACYESWARACAF